MDKPQVIVKIPSVDDASDKTLINILADIVNTAYTIAESDIFIPSYKRTSETEIAQFIRNNQLAVAYLAPSNEPIGCVFIKLLTPALGEFGMLALDTKYQGTGLGRQLAVFAEDECRRRGCTTMQLEILVPSTFHHEGKARLLGWYTRMGYKLVKLGDFGEDYPDLVNLLAGPTEYRVFEKTLV
jgi:GNAT superfamily N-acetyltransferase